MNHLKTNHSGSSRCLPVPITLAALAMRALASISVAWRHRRDCSPTPSITGKSAFTTPARLGRATVAAK